MVQVNVTRFATEKRIFFAVYKAGFEEIRETALALSALWCMNMKNLKHFRKRRQAVIVVKTKNNKNPLLTQLSM